MNTEPTNPSWGQAWINKRRFKNEIRFKELSSLQIQPQRKFKEIKLHYIAYLGIVFMSFYIAITHQS